jgi:hypothetical protein
VFHAANYTALQESEMGHHSPFSTVSLRVRNALNFGLLDRDHGKAKMCQFLPHAPQHDLAFPHCETTSRVNSKHALFAGFTVRSGIDR